MIISTCVFAETKSRPYTNTSLGFSMMLPEDWHQAGNIGQETVSLKNDQGDMEIKVYKGPVVKSLEEIKAYNLQVDPGAVNEKVTLNGIDGIKAIIHVNINGVEMKNLSYVMIAPKAQYIITGTADVVGADFDSKKIILENIIETFKVK